MTKFLSKEIMDKVKMELESFLEEKHPDYVSKISIHLDQKFDLIEVSKGLYTLSDEDWKLLHKK